MKKSARNGLLILCGLTIFGAFILFLLTAIWGLGCLTPWQKIILPERAVRVLAPDALVTSSGQIYQYDPYDLYSSENGWVMVDSPKKPEYPVELLRLEECGWIPSTKKYMELKITCAKFGPGTITKILAIDKHGKVFYWEHPQAEAQVIFLEFAPLIGAILGFGLGIIILLGIWMVSITKRFFKNKHLK
jgi:hypothetical protein